MIACHIEQDDSYPCKRYGIYCVPDAIPELVSMMSNISSSAIWPVVGLMLRPCLGAWPNTKYVYLEYLRVQEQERTRRTSTDDSILFMNVTRTRDRLPAQSLNLRHLFPVT